LADTVANKETFPRSICGRERSAAQYAVNGYDNGVEQAPMSVYIQSGSNVITYTIRGEESGWTASGSKGVGLQVVTVFLD
jgi:hypothetical protein